MSVWRARSVKGLGPWFPSLLLAGIVAGCGGGANARHPNGVPRDAADEGEQQATEGDETPVERPPVEGALELTLARPDGHLLFVGEMRGQPVMLYFFATYDVASQANVMPLSTFAETHPEVRVVAVAIQPNARQFVDAWVSALRPPFEAAFDPDDAISQGTTPLGQLGVPTFVLLDADGVPRAALAGGQTHATIEEMLTRLP